MLNFTKTNSEKALIKGCLAGKRKAQQQLYNQYAEQMLGVCIRYVRQQDEAEDLMIAGFTKVFAKIDQFQGEGSFEGWIRRIMVNECLMYLRKYKKLNYAVEIETAEREIELMQENTQLEAEDLLKMVQQLPDGYRAVFNLYAIEGYNHKEIAKRLNISEGTSKSQLSKARGLLKKMIAQCETII